MGDSIQQDPRIKIRAWRLHRSMQPWEAWNMGEETTETIQGRKDISRPRNSSRGHWLQLDASSRRKSQEEESTRRRKMPLLRKESLESLSAGTGVSAVENNGFKDDDIDPEPVLPLSVPSNSSRHNCATESDDEIEEIGALIYDQVMQRRQSSMRRRTRSSMK